MTLCLINYELSGIDLKSLTPVKVVRKTFGAQDHSRWILRGPDNIKKGDSIYYKIWNASYVRRDNLEKAIEVGFYDFATVPALLGLIYCRGLCRGYVMRECKKIPGLDHDFANLIFSRTATMQQYAVQFSPSHAMAYEGSSCLIDLEGVYPLSELYQVQAHHSAFAYPPYAEFVERLFRQCFPSAVDVRAQPVERSPGWLPSPLRKAKSALRRRRLVWQARIRPHLDEIEF